jgi:uncharacterized protein YcfL
MKALALISLAAFLTVSCSSNKFDKKRLEVQRQEAIEMIKQSEDIKIDKGLGDDKIILKDQ